MASSIKIHGFNTVLEQTGTELTLVVPTHPCHWDVPMWWYDKTKVYEGCARVDIAASLENYELYIATSSNQMELRIDLDNNEIEFDKDNEGKYATRAIIVVAGTLPAVVAGSTEYNDYEYVPRQGWLQRYDGLPLPTLPLTVHGAPQIESPLEVGTTAYATQAPTWTGGTLPYNYQFKWQHKLEGAPDWVNTSWDSNWDGEVDTVPEFLIDSASLVGHVIQLGLRVRDASDPQNSLSSFGNLVGPVHPVAPPLEIAPNGGANWPPGQLFKVGETVTALTASYTGGAEPVTYVYRWEYTTVNGGSWNHLEWVTTTNAKNEVSYLLPLGVMQIRIVSRATDANGVEVSSYTGTKTVIQPLVVTEQPVLTGVPVVGTTITCGDPTFTGGNNPVIVTYMESVYDNGLRTNPAVIPQGVVPTGPNHAEVYAMDLGKWLGFLVLIRDDDGEEIWTETSNRLGPVVEPTTIGDVSISPASASAAAYDQLDFTAVTTGDATDLVYAWSIRSGQATIVGGSWYQSVTVNIEGAYPGSVQVQCDITSAYSSDSPGSSVATVYLVE